MEITHGSCKRIFVLGHFAINLNEFFWLVVSTPLKNMKVSWDDYIFPTEWKVMKGMFQNHQSMFVGHWSKTIRSCTAASPTCCC